MKSIHVAKRLRRLFVAAIVLPVGGFALAQSSEPVAPKLTPKLQGLLKGEMVSINEASQQIFSALVGGNNAQVAALAQQIHESFIMRRSMMPEDKANLMSVAPKEFIQMDKAFHAIAAELAQAARAGDTQLQLEKFSRMTGACTDCHVRYAFDRFPGLAN